ncbi:hypothetical protein D9613_007398 [Agrocybe pediades]|uniref:Uncharacterized protein n=1 Tax=Agrocybe pediades TaxID=84607 RepID=A0A8H4VMJ3_9AGAR|nr:hypothetical protein D9613_007398 [Agrocybe pediades]
MASAEDVPHKWLPQEIVDHIIDDVQTGPGSSPAARVTSRRTLAACALVSRSWRYRSQRYIFRQVVFTLVDAEKELERAQQMAELLDSPYEGISCHVRALIINFYPDHRYFARTLNEDSSRAKILRKLFLVGESGSDQSISLSLRSTELKRSFSTSTLENIASRISRRLNWRRLPEWFTNLLLDGARTGKLKSLHLSCFQNIPRSFLALSTLESIGLDGMVFNFERVPDRGDSVPPEQTTQTLSDRAKILLFEAFNGSAWDPPKLDVSEIRVLRISLQANEDWYYAFTMAEVLSSSLESLKIVTHEPLQRRVAKELIPHFKNLKELTIVNSGNVKIDFANSHVGSICELLLPQDDAEEARIPILESLDIHIILGSTKKLGGLKHRNEGYADLDEVLASSPTLRLTRVITVHFFLPSSAQVAGLNEGVFEEKVRSEAEAAFPKTIEARANIGPFEIVVDFETPDINANEAYY